MVKRILISLCLISVLFSGLPARAYAAEAIQIEESVQMQAYILIEPFWSHTVSIAVSLTINNGRALMTGTVIGRPGTERISVNARLERRNANGSFTHIASWNNIQATGNVWVWERPHHVARGHYYRLTLTATVFRNGQSETIVGSRITRAN